MGVCGPLDVTRTSLQIRCPALLNTAHRLWGTGAPCPSRMGRDQWKAVLVRFEVWTLNPQSSPRRFRVLRGQHLFIMTLRRDLPSLLRGTCGDVVGKPARPSAASGSGTQVPRATWSPSPRAHGRKLTPVSLRTVPDA